MGIVNIILIVAGVIIALFGIGAFLNPNLARWINAPGTQYQGNHCPNYWNNTCNSWINY